MSEVNADGVLLNPHEHLLQEVQNLTNSLMAAKPAGAEGDETMTHEITALNGEPAGTVGGAPHMPAQGAEHRAERKTRKKRSPRRSETGKRDLGFHHGPDKCGKSTRRARKVPEWESYRRPRFRGAQRKRRQENG